MIFIRFGPIHKMQLKNANEEKSEKKSAVYICFSSKQEIFLGIVYIINLYK